MSAPLILRAFRGLNDARTYGDQIKPLNVLLGAHVSPLSRPARASEFHLVAPYERGPSAWLRLPWVDLYSGRRYAVTTSPFPLSGAVHLKSFRDVLEEYATHPAAKSAAPNGGPCTRDTVGLLRRRPVESLGVTYVGK